jgi:hypothetical protein
VAGLHRVRRNATTLRQPFEERAAKQAIIRSSEMARKTFPVTDAMRERVRRLAGVGVPQHDIAAIIECDEKTLRKHFSIELNRGVAEANVAAASYLFAKVKEGNVVAQIFWMKTRGHWREGRAPEDPVPGTEAESHPYVIILPDNGRDPQVTEQRLKEQDKYFARKRR